MTDPFEITISLTLVKEQIEDMLGRSGDRKELFFLHQTR
jgi:hypothetical protein